MRKIWVKADPWDKELVLTALECGADGIMVPDGCSDKVKELGRITTLCADGDLVPGKDVELFTITSGADEAAICRLASQKLVILECTDWTIIPLENLIAKGADVAALVRSFDEAQLAFGILEKGVKQVMLDTRDPMELKKTLELLKGETRTLSLVEAEIIEVKNIGMGDRVCVDTCQNMKKGEGMLVGNSSSALFLVHAETVSNPYVAQRPFRVNAGAVHAYTRVPGGRTRYLSEIEAGDEVEIIGHDGTATSAVVGRIKIEKRPMLLITARIGEKGVATIVQNAETIRLTSPEGEPLSVVALSPGDRVMAYHEEGGRHFGHKVDETITEK
ncbi:3-dehydroquinate synthase II [Desulfoluna sp.]|uniref:3-dehydroquinate synthase II n=1 Tax=Desulfoluna sp. TaxID=2045199 RepID=UPI0026207C7D|nr:3-dehydroquinate synthase II [Desulfoluna sp.]